MPTVSGGLLQNLALLGLVVFFVTPSRFLRAIHWGVASLLAAFVFSGGPEPHTRDPWFWGFLLFGAGCVAFGLHGKISPKSKQEENHS